MIRLAVITILGLVILTASGRAADHDSSFEKCTCKLTGDATKNGSNVSNASLCVQSRDKTKQLNWCTVSIHCLDDGVTGPKCERVIGKIIQDAYDGGNEKVEGLIDDYFASLFKYHASKAPEREFADDIEFIRATLLNYRDRAIACMQAFVNFEPIKIRTEDETFRCVVMQNSRWLSMAFDTKKNAHIFQFSPFKKQ